MKINYLLKSEEAVRIYESVATLPIIDFHNHISLPDISTNKRFESIYELWVEKDPYKHRLMRICGVPEHLITGSAAPQKKFAAFCAALPYTVGSPVYDWARMELSAVFGINELPCKENADYLYAKCGEMLATPEFSVNEILKRFHIEYQSPVISLLDDLSVFDSIHLAPSLRGDNLLSPTRELYDALMAKTGIRITDTASYLSAVSHRLDALHAVGCRFADHALDDGFFESDVSGEQRAMLMRLAQEYAKRGWTLLLHLDAKRKTSTRLARLCGPTGGYAAVGGHFPIGSLCGMLSDMEAMGGLPDTVLFPLNMSDIPPLAVMQGSFAEDGTPSKVQLGPAWWWCDHALGIEATLDAISSFGVLSQFIGMTTDSRSPLSFVRHDYFRRILCNWLDTQNAKKEWDLPFALQAEIARKICYQNAKDKIERKNHYVQE